MFLSPWIWQELTWVRWAFTGAGGGAGSLGHLPGPPQNPLALLSCPLTPFKPEGDASAPWTLQLPRGRLCSQDPRRGMPSPPPMAGGCSGQEALVLEVGLPCPQLPAGGAGPGEMEKWSGEVSPRGVWADGEGGGGQ